MAIRWLLLFEAAAFIVASLVHSGVIATGYEHVAARTAEAVLAIVLLAGAAVTWVRPTWTRAAALIAQAIALFGTLIGIFTIVVGVGPRTIPDVVYHTAMVAGLAWGLTIAKRAAKSGPMMATR